MCEQTVTFKYCALQKSPARELEESKSEDEEKKDKSEGKRLNVSEIPSNLEKTGLVKNQKGLQLLQCQPGTQCLYVPCTSGFLLVPDSLSHHPKHTYGTFTLRGIGTWNGAGTGKRCSY